MRYLSRIRNILKIIQPEKKYTLQDLLQPDLKYTGTPFISFQEMFKHFGIKDEIHMTNEQMQSLYENGLINVSINELGQAMKDNI